MLFISHKDKRKIGNITCEKIRKDAKKDQVLREKYDNK